MLLASIGLVVMSAGLARGSVDPPSTGFTAPRISGWLRTAGNQIVDASGSTVRFLGVDDEGMDGGRGNTPDACGLRWTPPSKDEYDNVLEWGFNSLRVAVSWSNLEPTAPIKRANGTLQHNWNTTYLQALDTVVAELGKRGIAMILDMHQAGWSPAFNPVEDEIPLECEGRGLPVWLYPDPNEDIATARCNMYANKAEPGVVERPRDGLVAAWKLLAKRYASNPTVTAFDVFNEPAQTWRCPTIDLAGFYQVLGTAIRSVNNNALLILQDNGYASYTKKGFALSYIPAVLDNVVYSWHFYPSDWVSGVQPLQDHVDRAAQFDVPLWLGEFNAFNYGKQQSSDPAWSTDLSQLMSYCRSQLVGWSFWAYSGGSTLVQPGTTQPRSDLLTVLQSGF